MVSPEEALKVVLEVTGPLDQLGVPYVVGGSLASSLHGIPRTGVEELLRRAYEDAGIDRAGA